LLAKLADEDVHRAVAGHHLVAPDLAVEAVSGDGLAPGSGQFVEDLELARGEPERAPGGEGLDLLGVEGEPPAPVDGPAAPGAPVLLHPAQVRPHAGQELA